MRTKKILKHLILGALLLTTGKVVGQSTTPGNVMTLSSDFLGWNNTFPANNFPLMVRHDLNQPIDFYTDSLFRMRIYRSQTSLLNGQPNIVQDGFVGISNQPLFFTSSPGPFSRLHLVDRGNGGTAFGNYAQWRGYRRWQRNGVTFTGNSDQGYVGQKYLTDEGGEVYDHSDMVLQWSNDVPGENGPDHLRFLFTASYDTVSTYGAHSMEGLEGMRFTPINDTTMHVGVGDFHRASIINGSAEEPTERLHVNDGTMRIDSLVPDYRNDTLSRVMMTDGDGRVHWRPIDTWPQNPSGGAGCEWERTASQNKITTAWRNVGSNLSCPEADWKVGIGNGGSLSGKLTVFQETGTSNRYGAHVTTVANGLTENSGVYAKVDCAPSATGKILFGVQAIADNSGAVSQTLHGVHGFASLHSGSSVQKAYGLYGKANNPGDSTVVDELYGAWVTATGAADQIRVGLYANVPTGTDSWAVYSNGDQYSSTNSLWTTPSDEALKDQVEPLTGALARLLQLRPKQYVYRTEEYPHMNMSSGIQYGVLAQELEEVFPSMVGSGFTPAELDSNGVVIHPEVTYKTVNLSGILPMLVSALQEQQQLITAQQEANDAQQERLDQLEDALAACCANPDRATTQPTGTTGITAFAGMTPGREKLHIQPNPFNERTTVYYLLEKGGRAQLMANSADGKELRVLHEATLTQGSYQYEWDTAGLAAGIYYVTLLVDGEPVVKKAVKVDR